MAKDKNLIFWIIGMVVAILLVGPQLGLFSISGNSMSRDVPSTVSPNQEFSVIYTASNSGTWGASIVDNVNGGCKFPDGSNQLKTVMLSTDGSSKTIKVKAPSSGSCTFSGNYKFGTEATKNFPSSTVTVTITDDYVKHYQEGCYNDDVYWYDSEGIINDKKEECGSVGCLDGVCNINGDGNGVWCVTFLSTGEESYESCQPFDESQSGMDCYTTKQECISSLGNFDLNQVLFKIGEFGVTILTLLIFIVSLFVIKIMFSKR